MKFKSYSILLNNCIKLFSLYVGVKIILHRSCITKKNANLSVDSYSIFSGSSSDVSIAVDIKDEEKFQVTYLQPGNYVWKCEVKDSDGLNNEAEHTVNVIQSKKSG